jgi:hypothetical protein
MLHYLIDDFLSAVIVLSGVAACREHPAAHPLEHWGVLGVFRSVSWGDLQ